MAEESPSSRLRSAEAGNAEACFEVGCHYTHGQNGFVQDHDLARRWLYRAAELSPKFAFEVGLWLDLGDPPFERDPVLALSLFRTAAAQGDQGARFEVARRSEDQEAAKVVYLEVASRSGSYSTDLAAVLLLGEETAKKYITWKSNVCFDRAERRRVLEKLIDPNRRRGLFRWRAPWE